MNVFTRVLKALQNKPYAGIDEQVELTKRYLLEKEKEKIQDKPIALWRDDFVGSRNPALHKPVKPSVSFKTLRSLRELVPIIEIAIMTLRKEVTQSPWEIVPVAKGEPFKEEHIKHVETLFKFVNPQRENFRILLDKLLDDLLMYDGAALEKLRTFGGELVGFDVIDASTIRPVLNAYGEYPENAAYVQIIQDKIVTEFPKEDIVYIMQNPQNAIDRFGYGKSPIEKILYTVQGMLNADTHNLQTFTEDNVPAGMLYLGKMTPDQAKAYREFWNDTVQGKYPQLKFTYSSTDTKPEFTSFKSTNRDMQFQEYVDWLSRLILAEYGLTPMDANITHDVNRATAAEESKITDARGVASLKNLIEEVFNREIIWGELQYEDIKFRFIPHKQGDKLSQAKIDEIYVKNDIMLADEIRIRDGLAPLAEAEAEINDLYGLSPEGNEPPTPSSDEDINSEDSIEDLEEKTMRNYP